MPLKTIMSVFVSAALISGCQMTTDPVLEFASENVISYRYHGYDVLPTLPIQVRDMAQNHCASFGKNAVYRGGRPANMISTEEIHDFTCEVEKMIIQEQ